MLGCEVWAHLATITCPFMTFFEVNFVIRTVAHPDLKDAFDVHLDHLFFFQTVFGEKEFFKDCVIKSF